MEEPNTSDRTPNLTYWDGYKTGIRLYAWWKDGVQYVGCGARTLKEALSDIDRKLIEENLPSAI